MSADAVIDLGQGTCSITASQAGSANYTAATSVTQSFTVTAAAGPLGVLTAGSATTGPGGAFSIPITLALNGGIGVNGLNFSVRLRPMAARRP